MRAFIVRPEDRTRNEIDSEAHWHSPPVQHSLTVTVPVSEIGAWARAPRLNKGSEADDRDCGAHSTKAWSSTSRSKPQWNRRIFGPRLQALARPGGT